MSKQTRRYSTIYGWVYVIFLTHSIKDLVKIENKTQKTIIDEDAKEALQFFFKTPRPYVYNKTSNFGFGFPSSIN